MYELYYRTGGHGGPYRTLKEAITVARRKLTENEGYIMIINKTTNKMVAKVDQEGFSVLEDGEVKHVFC